MKTLFYYLLEIFPVGLVWNWSKKSFCKSIYFYFILFNLIFTIYTPIDIQNLIYMGLLAKTAAFHKVSLKKNKLQITSDNDFASVQ